MDSTYHADDSMMGTDLEPARIFSLPNELLEAILQELDQNSRVDLACVCKLFAGLNARSFGLNLKASRQETLASFYSVLQPQEDRRKLVRSLRLSAVHFNDKTQLQILSQGNERPFLKCLGHENSIAMRHWNNVWAASDGYGFKCELCMRGEHFMEETLSQLENLKSLTIKLKMVHKGHPKTSGILTLKNQIAQLRNLTTIRVGRVDNTDYRKYPELSTATVYFNTTYEELRAIMSLPFLKHLHMAHISGHNPTLKPLPLPSERLVTLKLERGHFNREQFRFILEHAGPLKQLDLCKVFKVREDEDNEGKWDSHGYEVRWYKDPYRDYLSRNLTFTSFSDSLKRFEHTLQHLTIQHCIEPFEAEDLGVVGSLPALKTVSIPFSTFTRGYCGSGEDCIHTSEEKLRADMVVNKFSPVALEYLELTQMEGFCMAAPIVHRVLRWFLCAKVRLALPLKQIMLNGIKTCWMVSHFPNTSTILRDYIRAQAGLRPSLLEFSEIEDKPVEGTEKYDDSNNNRHEVGSDTNAGKGESKGADQKQQGKTLKIQLARKEHTKFARVCSTKADDMGTIYLRAKSMGVDIALAPLYHRHSSTKLNCLYCELDEDPFLLSPRKFYPVGIENQCRLGEGCLSKYTMDNESLKVVFHEI
ncbi:MAG: hypothetical protein M1831_007026 [Alyxoria varia]|nr:MAG: hypothetical protein M1831_007026 [Alyxoria varia]